MEWFNKRQLSATARKQVQKWANMNKDAQVHHVIPVSTKTALILYERDQMNYQLVLTIPMGETEPVVYYSVRELPKNRRRLRSQVEQALLSWDMSQREAELEALYNDTSIPVNDSEEKRQPT